jgi:hypothetical protein
MHETKNDAVQRMRTKAGGADNRRRCYWNHLTSGEQSSAGEARLICPDSMRSAFRPPTSPRHQITLSPLQPSPRLPPQRIFRVQGTRRKTHFSFFIFHFSFCIAPPRPAEPLRGGAGGGPGKGRALRSSRPLSRCPHCARDRSNILRAFVSLCETPSDSTKPRPLSTFAAQCPKQSFTPASQPVVASYCATFPQAGDASHLPPGLGLAPIQDLRGHARTSRGGGVSIFGR